MKKVLIRATLGLAVYIVFMLILWLIVWLLGLGAFGYTAPVVVNLITGGIAWPATTIMHTVFASLFMLLAQVED